MKINGVKSAAKEIADYEAEVNEALHKFYNRERTWEPCTEQTPLHSLLESEDGSLDEWGIRRETVLRMFDYFCAEGPHIAKVMRRVYALGAHMAIPPFSLFTVRERGLMLGDTHGAQHWRMQQMCVNLLRRKGAHSTKAPGQKGSAASAAGDRNARVNHNRCKHKWIGTNGQTACRKCGTKKRLNAEVKKE